MATTSKKTTVKTKPKTTAKAKKPAVKKISAKAQKTTVKSTVKTTPAVSAKSAKATTSVRKTRGKMEQLRIWNFAVAFLNFAQGLAIILLANEKLYPVTTAFSTKDAIASTDSETVFVSATRNLFDLNIVYVIVAFFLISALAHLSVATWYRKRYEASISFGMNRARWFLYGISASVVMIGVAMVVGVSDLSTLLLVFGSTMIMSLCGLIMEAHNQLTARTSWLGYKVSALAAVLPWAVVGIYLWGANTYGTDGIQNFVYWIAGTLFVVSAGFALSMYLQYKKIGRWSDYMFGEKTYMVLSLVFNSAIAWQLYVSVLA